MLREIRVPDGVGESAVVQAWYVAPGERVAAGEALVELEFAKVNQEVASPEDGILVELCATPGDRVAAGGLLARLHAGAEADQRLSPAVRRALRDDGVAERLIGSGVGGRVTQADVTPPEQAKMGAVSADPMRRAIAGTVSHSAGIPSVTAMLELDCEAILAHRVDARRRGRAVPLTAYFVSACATACATEPAVNGVWRGGQLKPTADLDLALVTALPNGGLVTPVLRRVQTRPLETIAEAIRGLAVAARTRTLLAVDMAGATLTLSNHGVFGALVAAPIIIVPPQVAAVGIGRITKKPVVREEHDGDHLRIARCCIVTLTIDHRALDAVHAGRWLRAFVDTLQQWPPDQALTEDAAT